MQNMIVRGAEQSLSDKNQIVCLGAAGAACALVRVSKLPICDPAQLSAIS